MTNEAKPEHTHEWNPDLTTYEKATEYEELVSLDHEDAVELRRSCPCGVHERATLSKWQPAFRDKRLTEEARKAIHASCQQLDAVQNAPNSVEKFLRFRRCVDEATARKLQS
jgi:hypothetical protein